MTTKAWFPTFIHHAPLMSKGLVRFNAELFKECHQIREFDVAGWKWSAKNYPGAYTSYGSMDKLHQFSSTFIKLEKLLSRHARAFAKKLEMDLGRGRLAMSDCWVNIMKRQTAHGLHLHPNSVLSGTYYVHTPRGCAGLKFEDPRLSRMMAAPPKQAVCRAENQRHITYPAEAGTVILFESWLRHEVVANQTDAERVSISFNYAWL